MKNMKKFLTASALLVGVAALGATACTSPGAPASASGSSTTAAPQATAPSQPAATVTALPTVTSVAAQSTAASPVAPTAASPAAATQGQRTYQIQQDSSVAHFVIDEVLRGSPFTVNGTTNQISGQFVVDPTRPSSAQLGTIRIDARNFATESTQRDRAIQNWVLETAKYPEITFTPKELKGLPTTGNVGETYTFQIVGDLTVHGVTREETFDATLTVESPTRLTGQAQTTIRYADYGINIPQVPIVSGIAETVRLEMDFVATAA